jgi:hypothetical protein
MTAHHTGQGCSTCERLFPDIIGLVKRLIFPVRLPPVRVQARRGWESGRTRWMRLRGLDRWLSLAVVFVLLAATAAWADQPALPAGVPNIYDPAVRADFRPVGVVNLGGNSDFPVVLLVSTAGKEPQGLLFGLDARNGKATWSLTSDPIILIVVVPDNTARQRVYVDTGFADLGSASGAYTAVDGLNSPVLPELLRAVFAAKPQTNI